MFCALCPPVYLGCSVATGSSPASPRGTEALCMPWDPPSTSVAHTGTLTPQPTGNSRVGTGPHTGGHRGPVRPSLCGTGPKAERTRTAPMDHTAA